MLIQKLESDIFYQELQLHYHHSHAQLNVQLSFPYTHSLKRFLLEGKRK